MRILFAAPRFDADLAALPLALRRAGHEVGAVALLDEPAAPAARPTRVRVPYAVGAQRFHAEMFQVAGPGRLPLFLARPEAPVETGSVEQGLVLSQIAAELSRRLAPAPQVLHALTWHAALAAAYVHAAGLPARVVVSLDEPAAQGDFPAEAFALANLPGPYFQPWAAEYFGRLNFLKAGVALGHAFVTDGRAGLSALARPPHGAGMESALAAYASKAAGIVRPLADPTWNPAADALLARRYRPTALAGKSTCRSVLLTSLSLAKDPSGPVFLLDRTQAAGEPLGEWADTLDRLLADDVRLVVLMAGSPEEMPLEAAARRHAARLALVREADDALRHAALGGADVQIFPNTPRPGFVSAVGRALRYGAVPAATRHDGAAELFADAHMARETGEGFLVRRDDPAAWWDALSARAGAVQADPAAREALVQRAMLRAGAAWSASAFAEEHAQLYARLAA